MFSLVFEKRQKGLSGLKAKHFGKNTFCRFKIVGLRFRQISVEHLDERLGAVSSVGRLADPDERDQPFGSFEAVRDYGIKPEVCYGCYGWLFTNSGRERMYR